MTTQDLDYLPACEIKDILQGTKKITNTYSQSPSKAPIKPVDEYTEKGVSQQIP